MTTQCWFAGCGADVDPEAAACPRCGSKLVVDGKYRIQSLLGEGGMGAVYLARDVSLGRRVAIKLMHARLGDSPERRARFEREMQAMAALEHPGIVRIYAAGVAHGQPYLVQEEIRGKALREYLGDAPPTPISPADAVVIAIELLDAVGHAHRSGVVHRDINPNNVLLVERGGRLHPVLIDFGLARMQDQAVTRVAWGGTPGYAAPEQILDPESNEPGSDLYAIGAVLYAMIAHALPYAAAFSGDAAHNGRALIAAYRAIADGSAALVPLSEIVRELSAPLGDAIRRSLAPAPAARFASAATMAEALAGAAPPPGLAAPIAASGAAPLSTLSVAVGAIDRDGAAPAATTPAMTDAAVATRARGRGKRFAIAAAAAVAIGAAAIITAAVRREPHAESAATTSSTTASAITAQPSASASSKVSEPASRASAAPVELALYAPGDVVAATDGSLYIADRGAHRIRVFKDGRLSTLAGTGEQGFADGDAAAAKFSFPRAIALGADGALYVADYGNRRVRVIRGGRVSTIAGSGAAGSDDGPAAEATFTAPDGLAVEVDGAVIVADAGAHTLRRIEGGRVSTMAGAGPGFADGSLKTARFQAPGALALGPDGALYVIDEGSRRVRMIKDERVSTVTSLARRVAPPPLEATSYGLSHHDGLAVRRDGALCVTDGVAGTVLVWRDGALKPFAGSGLRGSDDGDAAKARFDAPTELDFGPDGALYVVDAAAGAIRVVRDGVVSTVVAARPGGFAEGAARDARFNRPWSIARTPEGGIVVADVDSQRVRLIEDGKVRTLAGTGEAGYFDGAASNAQLSAPFDVAVDERGVVYVADGLNHRIRSIADGVVKTVAGSGRAGFNDGPAATASFDTPEGIALGEGGVIYVADVGNDRIRVVDGGKVSTLAGGAEPGFANGDALKEARFRRPGAIAVDDEGAVYVADAGNNAIRVIFQGRVRTLAGSGEAGFEDGEAAKAKFDGPIALALGADHEVFVADAGNHRVREIHHGVVKTIAGTGKPGYADGAAAEAWFARPAGLLNEDDGTLLIADSANNLIRVLRGGQVSTLAGH